MVPAETISPLRQRMLDDMRMRQLAPKTQSHYLRAVRQFAVSVRPSFQLPTNLTIEQTLLYFEAE